MICPACGFENPEEMKFCGRCATGLVTTCPSCGFESPPGFKFCGSCGTDLEAGRGEEMPAHSEPSDEPRSFAGGRYQVQKLLGEGGKKKVYLARDNTLDREVAFALIKTEGLDEAGRARITREAQAMGRLGDHPTYCPSTTWARSLRRAWDRLRANPTWCCPLCLEATSRG